MNLIKPHNDEFGIKYSISFDGNDHWITYRYKHEASYCNSYMECHGPRWLMLVRLAAIRYFQWRELNQKKAREAKSIYPHKVLPY